MLNKLSYSVTFTITGRTLAGEFEFKPGFRLITGANEQGKSLIIEVVRWCLFGSAALRGKAKDYKTLKATLEFSARDQSYVVDRTYTTAKLMQGDAVLCTGTTPVNKHIPALLGFGLSLFDVACGANQGDIERLGNLRPAERKKMVDTVIGLDRVEEIARWVGEEARGFEKQHSSSAGDSTITLAARHAVPTIYPQREYVAGGGLISYGAATMGFDNRAADREAHAHAEAPPM